MNFRKLIKQNEQEIVHLHNLIHSTFKKRDMSEKQMQEWSQACSNFQIKYSDLCFWNGVEDYIYELRSGNQEAIEYYITFIEIRPYFFRSGYMFKDIIRVLKNSELSNSQKIRYERVREKYRIYKENRKNRR